MNYKLKARGRHTYTNPLPGQYLKHPIQQLSHVLCGAGALLGERRVYERPVDPTAMPC